MTILPSFAGAVANHLWQSTAFAAGAGLLTLALRKNGAQIRYALWLAASLKFLIPFSLLISAGSPFEWRTAPAATPQLSVAIEEISQPFALSMTPAAATPAPAHSWLPTLLVTLWFCGCLTVLGIWWPRWRRIRTALRTALPLLMYAPVKVLSSSTSLEPGVFGIFRPVLMIDGADRPTEN